MYHCSPITTVRFALFLPDMAAPSPTLLSAVFAMVHNGPFPHGTNAAHTLEHPLLLFEFNEPCDDVVFAHVMHALTHLIFVFFSIFFFPFSSSLLLPCYRLCFFCLFYLLFFIQSVVSPNDVNCLVCGRFHCRHYYVCQQVTSKCMQSTLTVLAGGNESILYGLTDVS